MCLGKIRRRFEDFKSGGGKARAAWGIYCQVCLPKMILHTWHILSQAYWTEERCHWEGAEEGGRIWTRRKSSRQLCRLRGRRIRCGSCGSTSDQRQDEIDRWFKRVIQLYLLMVVTSSNHQEKEANQMSSETWKLNFAANLVLESIRAREPGVQQWSQQKLTKCMDDDELDEHVVWIKEDLLLNHSPKPWSPPLTKVTHYPSPSHLLLDVSAGFPHSKITPLGPPPDNPVGLGIVPILPGQGHIWRLTLWDLSLTWRESQYLNFFTEKIVSHCTTVQTLESFFFFGEQQITPLPPHYRYHYQWFIGVSASSGGVLSQF